jgi:hypothetical protein
MTQKGEKLFLPTKLEFYSFIFQKKEEKRGKKSCQTEMRKGVRKEG